MTARYALLALALATTPLAHAATCTWNGTTNPWQTPAAWSCGTLPGPSDDVVIGSGTVTFSGGGATPGAVTVRSLTMTGGILDGDGTLTVTAHLQWEAGTMQGPGSTISLGTAAFLGATSKTVGRTVYLRGTSAWSNGTLQFREGGVLVNEGAFTDDATGSHSIARVGSFSTEPYVLNRGTWTAASVGTNANVSFLNEGTLWVGGAGFKVIAPARFENGAAGVLIGTHLLDLVSGPTVTIGGRTQPGGAGALATFPITGPVPMTPTHVLDVDLMGDAGGADRLHVEDGTLTVGGRLLVRVSPVVLPEGGWDVLLVTHAGSGSIVGCYEPHQIDVRGPDGLTSAPYRVEVTCTSEGITAVVSETVTAGDRPAPSSDTRLTLRSATPVTGRAELQLVASTSGPATVTVFDARGRQLAVLFDGPIAAQRPLPLTFDGRALAPGLYVVRAVGPGYARSLRLTVAR